MRKPTTKAALKPETANRITANIIRILTIQGAFVTRINTVGIWDAAKGVYRTTTQRKGTPDIIACYKGWFMSFEVKAGKDKHSPEQQQVQQEIEKAGGACVVIRSTDDFIVWFNDHKK
jgi:penicillin-binding protein-related factor A (putative recombinase)